jgi:nucleoside-diphosphate-sugar epimerase
MLSDLKDLINRLYHSEDFSKLAKAEILITGGNSFMAETLLQALNNISRSQNFKISVHLGVRDLNKKQNDKYSHLDIHFFHYQIENVIQTSLAPSHIVHFAFSHSDNSYLLKSNSNSVDKLLKSFPHNPEMKFVYASSGAVYGHKDLGSFKINESDYSTSNHSNYSQQKVATEEILANLTSQGKIQGIAARLFSFYGSMLPLNRSFAICQFMNDGFNGREITINSSGESVRSYMLDSVVGLRLAQLLVSNFTGAINIGSENAISILELGRVIAKVFEVNYQLKNEYEVSSFYVPDTSLLQNTLGFIPECNLLAQILSWKSELTGN